MRDSRNDRPVLSQVTLCAATSVNLEATLHAVEHCLSQMEFAACKIFTDSTVRPRNPAIEIVPIGRLRSAADYSLFTLRHIAEHVKTSHCLVVQWDGHILDASRWRNEFLNFDYIGASWPQFSDGRDVGNGGFSLRSRRLMEACKNEGFVALHPEDLAIARTNRAWLEARGMCFAPRSVADMFSAERSGDLETSFGYHGVFNMPAALGIEEFWRIYKMLDDRSSIARDFQTLMKSLQYGRNSVTRSLQMIIDRLRDSLSRSQ